MTTLLTNDVQQIIKKIRDIQGEEYADVPILMYQYFSVKWEQDKYVKPLGSQRATRLSRLTTTCKQCKEPFTFQRVITSRTPTILLGAMTSPIILFKCPHCGAWHSLRYYGRAKVCTSLVTPYSCIQKIAGDYYELPDTVQELSIILRKVVGNSLKRNLFKYLEDIHGNNYFSIQSVCTNDEYAKVIISNNVMKVARYADCYEDAVTRAGSPDYFIALDM